MKSRIEAVIHAYRTAVRARLRGSQKTDAGLSNEEYDKLVEAESAAGRALYQVLCMGVLNEARAQKAPCAGCNDEPENDTATRPRRLRFNPLAASSVPIEYRFNRALDRWETRDLGQPFGWVVSDALAGYGAERVGVDERVIIGVRMSRGYPNNRPILLVESSE